MSGGKPRNRIPADQAKAFTAVNLPQIDGGELVQVVKETKRRTPARSDTPSPKKESVPEPKALTEDDGYQEGLRRGTEEGMIKGYTEGLEKGLAEGKQRGLEEGKHLAQKQVDQSVAQFMQVIEQLNAPLSDLGQECEAALMQTVITLAAEVIRAELKQHPERIQIAVSEAVNALAAGSKPIRVELHPSDLALVSASSEVRRGEWQLEANPKLKPGGCHVATEHSFVEYSLDHRFKQAVQQLLVDSPVAAMLDPEFALNDEEQNDREQQ